MNSLSEDIVTGLWSIRDIPPVTYELKNAAEVCIQRIEVRLSPAKPEWAQGAVVTLLTHFYTAELPKPVYSAIREDWLLCLEGFPDWAISQARAEWLKTNRRKPVPADIVALCAKAVSKERATLFLCKQILRTPVKEPEAEMSEVERTASIARVAEIVRSVTGAPRRETADE